ncbi:bifunctional non-homologous end joining protein LigD [Evansella caseinilytica]|uniref:DNA ligase (ATP) n=1 Tax=Evansella caseinilytica TaxID=1503961 RepID=A0A1H3TUM4_9BACI|nr:RNA ligase family protein [Evansella caseinilytica]SDZ53916.1 bifunctional non-homologous end joining protein LigD [Evansella caseinilytica]
MKLSPVVPFEPVPAAKIPSGDNWVGQIKWDGVRMLVYFDGENVRLVNRRLNDRTMQYPELTEIGEYCSAKSVILDGEVVAFENGKPSFHQVMKRDGARKQTSIHAVKKQVQITFMIFDVLYVDGEWVTDNPLRERQQLLEKIITQTGNIQLVKSYPDASALYTAVVEHELEGIVVKDINSKYSLNGKDKRWQKKKVIKDLVAVVGGVTYRAGQVNALLLGLYDDNGRFWYIGHAGTGKFTQNDWRGVTQAVQKLTIAERPFVNTPERHQGAVWLHPALTVKINFLEWTRSKTLRQPSIQAFVDVDASECVIGKN